MAGSLIKIDEKIASNDASITLGASNWDTSYDVYMVKYNNVTPSVDARSISLRVTKSGTADATSNYDYAYKVLNSASSFGNGAFTLFT